MKYMLDTNICIYIIKKKPPKLLKTFHSFDAGDLCISSITYAELQYGVFKSQHVEKNKIALISFIAPIEILYFSEKSAIRYGQIRTDLEKRGRIIGAYDMLIAAHALAENRTLITNNIKEFSRIDGLILSDWSK